ncbi:MarR family transcriptional regulator [Acetobacteraceae bacterium]|nr:MarR family transcriptional regulator [Candidatus Parcubacteria bacterium]
MTNRKQKIEGFMKSFESLQRAVKFNPPGFKMFPRITPSQWGALMVLGERDGSSIKEVADMLGITSSAATQLVDGLVANGYALRTEDAHDRRRMTVTLSGKTKKQVKQAKEQAALHFLELFGALTDEEFDQFILLHAKAIEGFKKKFI